MLRGWNYFGSSNSNRILKPTGISLKTCLTRGIDSTKVSRTESAVRRLFARAPGTLHCLPQPHDSGNDWVASGEKVNRDLHCTHSNDTDLMSSIPATIRRSTVICDAPVEGILRSALSVRQVSNCLSFLPMAQNKNCERFYVEAWEKLKAEDGKT